MDMPVGQELFHVTDFGELGAKGLSWKTEDPVFLQGVVMLHRWERGLRDGALAGSTRPTSSWQNSLHHLIHVWVGLIPRGAPFHSSKTYGVITHLVSFHGAVLEAGGSVR